MRNPGRSRCRGSSTSCRRRTAASCAACRAPSEGGCSGGAIRSWCSTGGLALGQRRGLGRQLPCAMSKTPDSYWYATRHPWSCILFVVPLLAAYEIGVRWMHLTASEETRNGADVWLRETLAAIGISPMYGPAALLLGVLLVWLLCRWQD